MRHGQRVPPDVVPTSEASWGCFTAPTLIAWSEHDEITPCRAARGTPARDPRRSDARALLALATYLFRSSARRSLVGASHRGSKITAAGNRIAALDSLAHKVEPTANTRSTRVAF